MRSTTKDKIRWSFAGASLILAVAAFILSLFAIWTRDGVSHNFGDTAGVCGFSAFVLALIFLFWSMADEI